jgi:predicted GNAT superfamily acetyltransferase
VTVRPLTPADLPRVLELNQGALPAVSPLGLEALERLVAQCSMALGVEAPDGSATAGELAGFCLVLEPGADYGSGNYRWFSERYDSFVYLDRVVVDEAHRGQGLGRALYEEVEQLATAPLFTLEVNLRPRNDGSLAFHAALGFTEVGQQETDYGYLVSMQAKPLG